MSTEAERTARIERLSAEIERLKNTASRYEEYASRSTVLRVVARHNATVLKTRADLARAEAELRRALVPAQRRRTEPPKVVAPVYPDDERAAFLEEIGAVAADKPAHAAYLADLISHYAAGGTREAAPDPQKRRGITWDIECALFDDAAALFGFAPPRGDAGYNRKYLTKRANKAVIAARAKKTPKES